MTGRWPANVVLDGGQADALDSGGLVTRSTGGSGAKSGRLGYHGGGNGNVGGSAGGFGDEGGPSRYFPTFRYQAKAPTSERPSYVDADGNKQMHATVKPLDLMRWLVRLVTPPGGTVLEPFAGSGTTIEAAMLEGFDVIGIEREADYLPLIQQRIDRARSQLAKVATLPTPMLTLFDEEATA